MEINGKVTVGLARITNRYLGYKQSGLPYLQPA